jgi:hypothetical protein
VLLTHYSAGNKIERNKMRGACRDYSGERGVYRVWWENLKERDRWGRNLRFK